MKTKHTEPLAQGLSSPLYSDRSGDCVLVSMEGFEFLLPKNELLLFAAGQGRARLAKFLLKHADVDVNEAMIPSTFQIFDFYHESLY